MIEKTLGIVLGQIKFGDTSLIVHLYTSQWGRMAILVPGARTSSKNRKAHLFQPLTLLELEVYHKPGRDLQKIREARNHHPFMHLTGDPVKSSIALFLADILHKTLREESPNSDLFEFLLHHIQYLDMADTGVANFHLYFLLKLSRYFGFNPGVPEGEVWWFDIPAGQFTPTKPVHGNCLDPALTGILIQLNQSAVQDLGSLTLNRHQRNEVLSGLLRYYQHHMEGLGEIRSHTVLKAIFE